jgi:hypothetical protein
MSFIDWSDPDDMFGLLLDFVTDELSEADDPDRREFLSGLLHALSQLQERFSALTAPEQIEALRAIPFSIDAEFASDPVVQHLEDCATELERVSELSSGPGSGTQ